MKNNDLANITESFYREYKDHVFNYIYRLSSNYELSLDITQQTFLKILNDKNILSLKSPKAYLFTVARNTLFNEWKKKKEYQLSDENENQAEQIPDEQTAIPDADVSQKDLKNKIELAIKSLPEKNRELMLLHYFEGLSYQEIVSVTGRKLSDVKVNLHRARHRFDSIFTTQMYRKVAASRDQCDEMSLLLAPYKDENIPDSQISIIDAHITSCQICSDDAQHMKKTRQLFSILPLFLAPSILDQLFNQSLAVVVASSGANLASSANAANSITTGVSKALATKIVASTAVVAILATGGYLLSKPDTSKTNSATVSSSAGSQTNTSSKAFNPSTNATVQVPKTVIAGSTFKIQWTGPNNNYDLLVIIDKNNPKEKYNYKYTHNNKIISLIAPESKGQYEVRYKTSKGTILASTPLTVLAATASIEPIESVVAGSKFNVKWTAANNNYDSLVIFDKNNPKNKHNYKYANTNPPITLIAPEKAGQYEVLYKTAKGTVLSKTSFTVVVAKAKIDPIKPITVGSKFDVSWSATNNNYDTIVIFDKNNPKNKHNYKYANTKPPLTLIAPDKAGQYEVLYKTAKGTIITKTSLTVLVTKAKIEPIKPITAGSKFDVSWSGTNNGYDTIVIFDKNNPQKKLGFKYAYTKSPATLLAPEIAGQYEVLYKTQKGTVLTKRTFTVLAASAKIEPIKPVVAGSKFKVSWSGTNNGYDTIVILDKNNPRKKYDFKYAYTKSPALLLAPEIAGGYEVLYKTQKGTVLTKTTFTVLAASANITPIKPVFAGSEFKVSWTGSNNNYDTISIIDKKNPKKKHSFKYVYTKSPATLTAPETAGSYEILYKTPKGNELAKTALIVLAATAKFQAIDPVIAGSKFKAIWTATNNKYDSIVIFNKNNPKKKYGFKYVYTKSPATLVAPKIVGQYEVLYKTPKGIILARTPFIVKAK